MRFKTWHFLLLILAIVVITVVIDIIRISKYETYPRKPEHKIELNQDRIYYDLSNGIEEIDWTDLNGTLVYINNQYDCADFRYVNLLRILYEYTDRIPKNVSLNIENTLLNFRYWWDEPGENSACYWSENHQILFASAEYLTGQLYPEKMFKSGLTGQQHMEKAKTRILDWLKMRWNYGFTEYYSNVYYKEDVGAMINLIDFAKDEEIREKTKIIMDLLFYDIASQSTNGMFISVSGRAYERNRKGGERANFDGVNDFYWGIGQKIKAGMMYGLVTSKNYKVPPVFAEIVRDTNNVVIKQCNGLDILDLKKEGYYGTDNRSMMMQWGMEAFSNPEIVRNSLAFIRDKNMFSNDFLKDFKILDYTILKWLHLEPIIVRAINPQSNGVAIQKGNTYTYRTKDYSLYSVQNHHPGTFGDQQHVAGMNINNHFSIFHTHPAIEEEKKNQSPNYWVGYGHLPHVAQDKNISMAIYNIPEKKGMMEMDLLDYTHAYFPKDMFDTVRIFNNYAMGKKGDTYCAFIGTNELMYKNSDDDNLIQKGKHTYWITEAGSKTDDGSFINFCNRIENNSIDFDESELILIYFSNEQEYQLTFNGDFIVNDKIINTEYNHYDSPYIKADKMAKTLKFECNGKSLLLDFNNMKRFSSN